MENKRTKGLLALFNTQASIARTFGMTLSYLEDGRAVVELPYNPNLNHALGGVHGGIYMTLLDSAAWFTAAAAHKESYWVATSELTVHFLKPAERTALRAVGRMLQSGKRQDIAEAHLYDETGQLIGHAVGTFVVLETISTA